MGGELWCGQAQNGVNLDFQVKFDPEGRSVDKTIGTTTKVFCIFCPNLVVLAWAGPELYREKASGWHTNRQTDTHRHRKRQYPGKKGGKFYENPLRSKYKLIHLERDAIYNVTLKLACHAKNENVIWLPLNIHYY